jgi:hypothetical protein
MKKIFIILLLVFGCKDDAILPQQEHNEQEDLIAEESAFTDVIENLVEIERKLNLIDKHLEENPIKQEKIND